MDSYLVLRTGGAQVKTKGPADQNTVIMAPHFYIGLSPRHAAKQTTQKKQAFEVPDEGNPQTSPDNVLPDQLVGGPTQANAVG